MKKTAIITGVTGQDGSYMAKLLLEKGYKVYGTVRRSTKINLDNLTYLGVRNDVDLIVGDLLDEAGINHMINTIRPQELYNMAAQSFVGISWDLNKWTTEVNCLGPLNLLNAIKFYSPTTKFYQASSAEMFGNVKQKIRSESTPFEPRSPYGISKLYSYWMTINFRESYGIHASNGIQFNHESPIRGKEFVTRKVTDGVARIKLGLANKIDLGNLDITRDWGYAGDFVEAAWRMLQLDRPTDFVLSTGISHSIRDLLEIAFSAADIPNWQQYIQIDPGLLRPAELYSLRGDSSKAKQLLGWEPTVDFNSLINMMVTSDLERVKNES
jgi:GDPmannose 4,6-dehydratase